MRYTVVLFIACWLSEWSLHGQKSFGRLALGGEISYDFAQYQAGMIPTLTPALVADVALSRLWIGGGLGREYYRPYEYYTWTGDIVERTEDGRLTPYYISTLRAFRPAYWTALFRLQYRLHRCQCVFLHAGLYADFFSPSTPEYIVFERAELRQAPFREIRRDQLFRLRTRSYEVGAGFNLLAHKFFRLTARPSIVVSEDPEVYTSGPGRITTARMTFGVQFGFRPNWP
ncbi:MAG: hypothetical protein NZM43_01405 [Saprospiraceae bacterium]|nr:hypothetical protein [Saprospiraceae bacterium]MDW8482956.1 hypothetical protein [Saprospiraceae bacterium]